MGFCGAVPHADIPVYYTLPMAFCLASRIEPFGIDLLEAGGFRLLVIATSVGVFRKYWIVIKLAASYQSTVRKHLPSDIRVTANCPPRCPD